MKCSVFTSARDELDGIRQWLDPASASPVAQFAITRYAAPAVIYGRRGGESDTRRERALCSDCAVLVRRTGGGAVLAGPWLQGVHLWLPGTHPMARTFPIPCMVWFGQLVAKSIETIGTLETLGYPVRLADAQAIEESRSHVSTHALDWSCFAGVSHGELLDHSGRKIFGLSQARVKAGVLLSGGLVCGPTPWAMLHYIHSGEYLQHSPMEELVSDGELFQEPGRCEALWSDLLQRLNTELTQNFLAVEPAPAQTRPELMEA